MILSREITETIELGDGELSVRVSFAYDKEGNELPSNLVIDEHRFFNGDPYQMLTALIDTLTVLQSALKLTSDDEVLA